MDTRFDNFEQEAVEKAKQTVVELSKDSVDTNVLDLFYTDNLEDIEKGIRNLNDFSSKCYILSSIALYTLIYDKNLWVQSGLTWEEYAKESRKRLGLDPRDISEQLASARFFINYRDALLRAGWTPSVPNFNLARGELALELCGSIDEAIKHICNDSTRAFKAWYTSFKELPKPIEDKRPDIEISNNCIKINGKQAITVSDELPETERQLYETYMEQIFTAIKQGYIPAIVPVYDEKEAKTLVRLRDKNRQGK